MERIKEYRFLLSDGAKEMGYVNIRIKKIRLMVIDNSLIEITKTVKKSNATLVIELSKSTDRYSVFLLQYINRDSDNNQLMKLTKQLLALTVMMIKLQQDYQDLQNNNALLHKENEYLKR